MMMMNSQPQQQAQAGQQQRQLVFVVEGTSALGPTWPLLVSEYVEKIVRSFCGFNPTGQKHNLTNGEMISLIVYDSHGSQNGCLLQQSGWTSNIDVFYRWLSSISFSGGGYGDAAVAEGLSAALQMCCPGPSIVPTPQGRDYQKHCVLIGASNPHKIPTPVHSPPVPNYIQSPSSNGDLQSEQWWLADAGMIAQAFPLCSVSLSVLAPRQLPLLRTIFSQAKRGGRTAEVVPEPPKQYSQHLLLISDAFMEARMVLHRTLATSNMASNVTAKIEHQPVAVPVATVPGQLPIVGARPIPSVAATGNGALAGRAGPSLPTQPVTVKTEAVTTGSLSSLLNNTNNPLPLPMQQPVSGQDAVQSPFNMTSPDPAQDFKVLGNLPASQPLRPVGASTLPSNSMLAHSPSQSRHTIGSPSLPPAGSPLSGLPSGVGVPVAPIVSTGGASSLSGVTQSTLGVNGQQGGGMGPSGLGVGQGVGLGNVHSTYSSATTGLGSNTMMGPSQSLSVNNIGSANNGQGTITGSVNQVGLSSSNQMGQTGHGLSGQNILGGVGNAVGSAGTGTMMPSSGIPQSPGQAQAHGGTNTAGASHMQHPSPLESGGTQQTTNNSLKYTRLWEGILAGQRKGNVVPIPICKLEGYRQTSSPETLAADWPPTMQIMRLIPQEYMNQNREYHRKAELLVFRPLTQHDFLVQLAEKKLCAVIQLPIQTLLLASTDKPGRMIGMLFPGEMVQIKPQVSSQQLTASATAAPQSGLTNNFSQNQLQGQVQNQLQGQVQNQLQGQVQNQLQGQVQNQIQLQGQVQNQLQGQVQNQLQGQVQNQLQGQVQNQLQGQVQNQLTNSQLPNQLTNQQPRSQLLPGSTTLHGAGFLP